MRFFRSIVAQLRADTRGGMLLYILIFGSVATTIIIGGVASYGLSEYRASLRNHDREMALQIAEAGINYYRWHLAHDPTDYQDGTGQPGPYVHNYEDKDGNVIGTFTLEITPPLAGSTVTTIKSTGVTSWRPDVTRTLQVRVGFPALSDYTFLSNANMAFSFTTMVNGIVHSNGGIRFDGTSDSWVRSAKDRYRYQNQWHNGVWGGGGPRSFWQFPVPAIDFDTVSADLAQLRTDAIAEGVHLTSSGDDGWHIVFTGNTFDLYRVNSVNCAAGEGRWRYRRWTGWYWDGQVYCYDIASETFVSSQAIPANGAIFVEDRVWVDGVVDGRVTVGAGRFPVQPSTYQNIIIPANTTYNQVSSDDTLGLIAQGDIIVPFNVPNDMTIQGALLSQYGQIYRPYYWNDTKNSLTVFGSQISYGGGGWKYVNGWGNVISGFINTNHLYDANLRYFPPPGFPVGNTYELISWEELEN